MAHVSPEFIGFHPLDLLRLGGGMGEQGDGINRQAILFVQGREIPKHPLAEPRL